VFEIGSIVKEEWFLTAQRRNNVVLHDNELIIMPNHIHGIIWLIENDEYEVETRRRRVSTYEQFGKPTMNSIPTIIRSFKSCIMITSRFNRFMFFLYGVDRWFHLSQAA
jgi:putative transposase